MDPGTLPDVWRASELARSRVPAASCGYAVLDRELPNGGWPQSSLTELLLQQHGIGELQLLQPMLARLARSQRIALVQPPCIPQAMAARHWDLDPLQLLWLRPKSSADALWSAEQILKNGSCGALLLWQSNIRTESLRRLHLAAQGSETWFWLLRPMAAALEPSPAPLRLGLRPAHGGMVVEVLKRRGPAADGHLFIQLPHMPARRPITESDHATAVQPAPTPAAAASPAPLLV
ncbi:translesion DNA synthesis-associated protein ImuA [Pseudoduganella rhizocola]|uniref:translesion DNA synthesis-associated protein ImuA n=1 Tax=Pseudoduganella rhizocola TaxID=3382643 RepID=UPI0038B4F3A3